MQDFTRRQKWWCIYLVMEKGKSDGELCNGGKSDEGCIEMGENVAIKLELNKV